METDWLEELQKATKLIEAVSQDLDIKAGACFVMGLDAHGEYLLETSKYLHKIALMVSRCTSGAVTEMYESARHSSMSMLAVVLASCELKDRKEG